MKNDWRRRVLEVDNWFAANFCIDTLSRSKTNETYERAFNCDKIEMIMGYAYDKTISQNRKKSIDCKSGKHPKSHKSNMDLSDLSPSVRVSLTTLREDAYTIVSVDVGAGKYRMHKR